MIFRAFVSTVSVLVLANCGSPLHVPTSSSGPLTQQGDDSFALLSANILQPKCSSCHSGSSPAGGIDLTNYTSILAAKGVVTPGDPAHSTLYNEIQSGDMPDGGPVLTANEVQAIHDWIAAGAPNGSFSPGQVPAPAPAPAPTPTPTPTPPPPSATYTQVQTEIFNVSCTSCHSGTKPSGSIDLSSYAKLMANTKAGLIIPGSSAKSLLYTEVASGNMPPRGTKVSAANVTLLQQWIDSGAANN